MKKLEVRYEYSPLALGRYRPPCLQRQRVLSYSARWKLKIKKYTWRKMDSWLAAKRLNSFVVRKEHFIRWIAKRRWREHRKTRRVGWNVIATHLDDWTRVCPTVKKVGWHWFRLLRLLAHWQRTLQLPCLQLQEIFGSSKEKCAQAAQSQYFLWKQTRLLIEVSLFLILFSFSILYIYIILF